MATKSIYVHDEVADVTKRFDLTSQTTARQVVQQFAAAHHGNKAAQYALTRDGGAPARPSLNLHASAQQGEDLFIAKTPMVLRTTLPAAGNTTRTLDPASLGVCMDTTVAAGVALLAKAFKDELADAPGVKTAELTLVVAGKTADEKALFVEACTGHDAVTLDSKKAPTAPAAAGVKGGSPVVQAAAAAARKKNQQEEELALLKKYLAMGEEALQKGAFARAIEIYDKLQIAVPGETQSAQGLAVAYMKAEKWDKAIAAWKNVMKLVPESASDEYLETVVDYSEALIKNKQCDAAVALLSHAIRLANGKPGKAIFDLKAQLGYAYYAKGDQEGQSAAAELWRNVLAETEQTHIKAMLGFTMVMQHAGQYSTTLRGLINILVRNAANTDIRKAFGDAVREIPNSLAVLQENLPLKEEEGSASAFGFLAMVMKERGGVTQSAEYYRKALTLSPSSASYALNLSHTLSIDCRYWEGLGAVLDFCKANKGLSVSNGGHRVTCADILPFLEEPMKKRDVSPFLFGEHAQEWAASGKALRWVDDGAVLSDAGSATPAPTTATVPANMRQDTTSATQAQYPPNELDLLALWFAAVKELYLLGCLSPLPRLVALLDPLRRGRALHTTLIRNEQAYFCTVGQLLQHVTIPPVVDLSEHGAPTKTMYLCGDSHSLSLSWNVLKTRNERFLLKNALVTGMKCWHMREGTHFYPKYNFINVTKGIPAGADVIMMFGEIDCREGILFAVEKCRYPTIEAGMQATIDIYLNKLLELQQDKHWTVYVHPALPILDVTRHLVTQFNNLLGATLLASERIQRNGNIKWLDFYEKMLTEDGKDLLPEYALDGTHANPAYISLLEEAMQFV